MNKVVCDIPAGTKVLVTGATGFTGSLLVRKLVAVGVTVHAIARTSSKLDALQDLPIRWFRGDVYDEATVNAAVEGVVYIFHVAAAYREAKYGDEIYWKVHLESTKLLAQAALRNPGFKRFVHVSTVGVLGHIANPPADETWPLNPGDIYQQTKAEAEQWIRAFGKEHGLPYTVIRPAAIYGPGDTRLLKFFKMAAKPWLVLIGHTKGYYHLIHVEDLTNVLILAATHPAAPGDVFICGNPECVTLEQMARIVARALGNTFRVVRLPATPVFLVADVCEWIFRKIGVEPPIHRRRMAFFTKDRSFNTTKLRTMLGYQAQYTNEQGLTETADWYCRQGWLHKRQQQTTEKKGGFTLWELVGVTVVVLVGLVLGVGLLPIRGTGHPRPLRTQCLSNQNAIWKAISAWGLDPSNPFRPPFPEGHIAGADGELTKMGLAAGLTPIQFVCPTAVKNYKRILTCATNLATITFSNSSYNYVSGRTTADGDKYILCDSDGATNSNPFAAGTNIVNGVVRWGHNHSRENPEGGNLIKVEGSAMWIYTTNAPEGGVSRSCITNPATAAMFETNASNRVYMY